MKDEMKNRGCHDSLHELVRFISDCWWFVKAWKVAEIKFTSHLKTRLTWSMARKRHIIKEAIQKQKSND